MESGSKAQLLFDSNTQKRLISNCYRNLNNYQLSAKWRIFENKFATLELKLPSDLFSCKHCKEDVQGYYFYKSKNVVLCANNIKDEEFDKQATQYMIMAYDDARADVDPDNPVHIACTTVRAVNLGGVCRNKNQTRAFKSDCSNVDCIREKSIQRMMRTFRLNKDVAEDYVHEVWDSCFYQHDPFSSKEFSNLNY